MNNSEPTDRPSSPCSTTGAGSESAPPASQVTLENAKEVNRRAELLLKSAEQPRSAFLCGTANDLLTYRQPGPGDKPIVLLFTNVFLARDYIRVTGATAEARQIDVEALPGAAQTWMQSGATRFGLNRCPRCGIMNVTSLDVLQDKDGFLKLSAISRATKCLQGEGKVREFLHFQASSRPRARAALELIRDHIDCSSPYLHELIAFFARMDGDENSRQFSLARLVEFGPQFADWDSRWGRASFGQSLAVALVGLANAFGVKLEPKSAERRQ